MNRVARMIAYIALTFLFQAFTEQTAAQQSDGVLTGIDVLIQENFASLAGKRVGLITNHTGRSRDGVSTARVLHDAANVRLVALFSPEHGIAGRLDVARIDDTRDPETGLPVYSLYGATRKPSPEMLQDLDVLVFDIQDIGTRFYTYIATMGGAMEAAAEADVAFMVLDRPNPIGGDIVEGCLLDAGRESFIAYHRLPVRHGMTVGELARMFNAERHWGVDLHVIEMAGWRRDDYFDACGLMWINPSPNMRSLTQALLYPGVGLLETTNVSVGRGTDTPFEVVGAPWIDGRQLAAALNAARLPGVRFVPIEFTPRASKHADVRCGGVNIIVTDRATFRSLPVGWEIASQLRELFSDDWDMEAYDRLLRNSAVLAAIEAGHTGRQIEARCATDVEQFLQRRKPYLLYK